MGNHLSGTGITSQPRAAHIKVDYLMALIYLALLPAGVYLANTSRYCWCALTAPLHPCHTSKVLGGMFLWHCPHGFPHWELPSKPCHMGARTFLKKVLFRFQNKTFLRLPLLLSFSIMLITPKNIYWGCSSAG